MDILAKLEKHSTDIAEIKKLLEIQNANIFDVKRHGEKVLNSINWDHLGKDITNGVAAGVAYELERIDATAHKLIQNANYLEDASKAHIDISEQLLTLRDLNTNKFQSSYSPTRYKLLISLFLILAVNLAFWFYYIENSADDRPISEHIQGSAAPADACESYGFNLHVNPDDGLIFCIFPLSE